MIPVAISGNSDWNYVDFSLLIFSETENAECNDTSYSVELPPKITAIFSSAYYAPLSSNFISSGSS